MSNRSKLRCNQRLVSSIACLVSLSIAAPAQDPPPTEGPASELDTRGLVTREAGAFEGYTLLAPFSYDAMVLVDMAGEIAREGVLRIRRPNRDYLLRVRAGEFEYEDLVSRAEEQLSEVIAAFDASDLQEQPDRVRVNRLLVEVRDAFD